MKLERTRDLSLLQLRAMEKIKDFDSKGFPTIPNSEDYLLVRDPNPGSNFYFSVVEVEARDLSKTYYLINYKPFSVASPDSYEIKIGSEQLYEFYNKWVELVNEYAELVPKQAEHDPILEQYEEEFYAEFELADEDADERSFSPQQQLLLNAYLDRVAEKLESYKEVHDLDDQTIAEIDSVIEDTRKLQETQTRLTKNQILKKLSNIFAQCKKIGLKVLGEVRSEVVKSLVKGVMNDPHGFLDSVTSFLG